MEYKIDWLTLTIKPEKHSITYDDLKGLDVDSDIELCPLELWLFDFLKILKIKNEFRFKCGSVQHYNYMYSYNGIDIALSNSSHFAEQGLMIRFSAQGIAYYEKYRKTYDKEWSWIAFLKEFFALGVYNLKCNCTRIDIAYDDISYDDNRLISLEKIKKAVKRGEAVTLFRRCDPRGTNMLINEITHIEDLNSKGELLGETIEFGNRKSAVFLRFYDKLKEQLKLKRDVDENIKHWVRMEFEFKQARAMAVCDSLILLNSDEFGKYFAQVVNRYLRFVKPEGDRKHYYRCKSRKWWRDIVGTVEKAKLSSNKAVKNRYKSSLHWLERTVYPTLYAVLNCTTIDKFLTDVQQKGIENHNRKHDEIISDYIFNKPEEEFKGIDRHRETTEEFELLVKELEITARRVDMLAHGEKLCDILGMQAEFEKFYKPDVRGMIGRNITEFENRQILLNRDMNDINKTFKAFGIVV